MTQGGVTQSTAGQQGTLTLNTIYPVSGGGTQTIALDLGSIGGTSGLTQFAGSTYTLRGISQNGVPPGQFSAHHHAEQRRRRGELQQRPGAHHRAGAGDHLPAPDALQRQNAPAFTATINSGAGTAQAAGNNGAGTLVTSSVEQSNVDIATEFSQLIVAQQAYSANAKMVTTADTMLQATLDMIQ